MRLTGSQFEKIVSSLIEAYPNPAKLEQMVRYRLEKNIHAIALGSDLSEIVYKLVLSAEAEGWAPRLLLAARAANPGNARLVECAHALGAGLLDVGADSVESIIRKTNSFLDVTLWRTALGEIEGRVCRIELEDGNSATFGTGFLISPDLVMTNHHVVASKIKDQSVRLKCRFDYKKIGEKVISPGCLIDVTASDWLFDSSPPGSGAFFDECHLDYAIIRVDRLIGNEPIGALHEPLAVNRGWIHLPEQVHQFKPGMPLFIMQHPDALPLKLAVDTDGIRAISPQGTRIEYNTNTMAGSSGSPGFDENWKLILLHHSGDPSFGEFKGNAGSPIAAIVELLKARSLWEDVKHSADD